MITAVDTGVLLDVFGGDPRFGPASREALRDSLIAGNVVACDVVWAELAASFPSGEGFQRAMRRLGVAFDPVDESACIAAGEAWKAYRARGGRRVRIIPDFMIGAHAVLRANRLLTRDRGFYRAYFRRLRILDPMA